MVAQALLTLGCPVPRTGPPWGKSHVYMRAWPSVICNICLGYFCGFPGFRDLRSQERGTNKTDRI